MQILLSNLKKVMKKQLPNISNNKKGFTLIELLVVIAIIAILATIGAAIFSGVQSRARDGRRQADIGAISKAFEANKDTGSVSYKAPLGTWFAGGAIPADTYTGATPPAYSIVHSSTSGCTAITKPTVWLNTSPNPTAAGGTGTCGTVTSATVTLSVPAGIITFQVCALLEGGTAPNIFCVPNQQ